MNKKVITTINQQSFSDYGVVIENKMDGDGDFEIFVEEHQHGWRIAVYHVTRKTLVNLEKHTESKESFEPLDGIGLLIVAVEERPEDFEVFLLDKPVCLHKGVWHQLISLSESTAVKITENLQVTSDFFQFTVPYKTFLCEETNYE